MRRPARRSNRVRSRTEFGRRRRRRHAAAWHRRVGNLVGRPFDRRIGRVDHQRIRAAGKGAPSSGICSKRRSRNAPDRTGWRRSRPGSRHSRCAGAGRSRSSSSDCGLPRHSAIAGPHQPHAPQEGRAQDAEDQRQIGAVHAQRRRHGDEGERGAGRLDQREAAAARMGQHHLAEAADQRQADQPAGPGMGRRTADVAQADAGHAHHQERQQQQRQAQPEEAEMVGAHHAHAPGDQRHRHQDDGEPEGLQQQVGDVGAGQAHDVVRRAAGRMVERGIARAVGEQRQQQRHAQAAATPAPTSSIMRRRRKSRPPSGRIVVLRGSERRRR